MDKKIIGFLTAAITAASLASPVAAFAGSNYLPFAEAVKRAKSEKLNKNPNFKSTYISNNISGPDNFSTYTNFILKTNRGLSKATADKIATSVIRHSAANNVDPKLVLALMARESSFRAGVVSKSGAIGLGQLKRDTAKDMGVYDPFNPEENVKGTVRYISWLNKRFNGNVDIILASYNMGPGAVKRALMAGDKIPDPVANYVYDIKKYHTMI